MEKNHLKKFRLIREYPGSPKLGDVATDQGSQYWYRINDNACYVVKNVHKYPEFWEEVIEKDYEILSYYNNYNKQIYEKFIGGLHNKITYYRNINIEHNQNENYCKKHYSIYQIKRLSDGEVFTIGDRVESNKITKLVGNIKRFDVTLDNLFIVYNGHDFLKDVNKCKKPLFITEDGVDIYEDDTFYELIIPGFNNESCVWNILTYEGKSSILYDQKGNIKNGRLWFSTKEAAEEYILMNKPYLSINDVINLTCQNTGQYNESELIKLVKSKL